MPGDLLPQMGAEEHGLFFGGAWLRKDPFEVIGRQGLGDA
jgi:hypothetical protein